MNAQDLQALAKEQGVDATTLQHEFREVRFLAGIADDPVLALHLAFKGGTALRLIYLSDRYSDDLDFDVVREEAAPQEILERLWHIARKQSLEITDAHEKRATVLLEVREPGWKRKLKIEASTLPRSSEVRTVVKNIVTPVFPQSVNVLTYPLPALLSGKMLAVLQRRPKTPRDLYDLFWLLSRKVEEDPAYFRAVKEHPAMNSGGLSSSLVAAIAEYDDRAIATELCAMLPKEKRAWVRENLKERTAELLRLRGGA